MTRHLMFSQQTAETAHSAVEFYYKHERITAAPFVFESDKWLVFRDEQFDLLKDALRMHEQFLLDEASSSEEHVAGMFYNYAIGPGTMLQALELREQSRSLDLRKLVNLRNV